MSKIQLIILHLIFCLFPGGRFSAQVHQFPLSTQATKVLVDSLASQISKFYVEKEDALRISAFLKKRCREGAYHKFRDPHLLAGKLTSDVLSVRKDEHFHVEYNPVLANELLGNIEDVPKMVAAKLNVERSRNFGFKKAEVLNGNIGYLEISSFSRLNKYSRATADAALRMLANTNALIIDLRYGSGGSPDMVTHLVSHFFKDKTHVTDIYIRSENATLPYWTSPDSSYGALNDIPVYILTSYKTFSAAEGLAYCLKTLKRATIVGETTRGGAHTVTYRPLSSGFVADIPFGKAINPLTKDNWEGKGLKPDIEVPSDQALETAEMKIFEQLMKDAADSVQIKSIQWQLALLTSKNHPPVFDSLQLRNYCGQYGPFSVSYEKGQLYYQKTGKARFPLLPLKEGVMRPRGNDTFSVEFLTDSSGRGQKLTTYYEDGRVESGERSD